jgi:hypothetical protein
VADFERRIDARMKPHSRQVQLLVTIPGVDQIVAWTMIKDSMQKGKHGSPAGAYAGWRHTARKGTCRASSAG